MKKILLASSALVAGAAFAAPAMAAEGEVVWSAFTQFHASSTGVDSDSTAAGGDTNKGLDFSTNSEIKLSYSATADNGLTYGLAIELESDQGGTGNSDENHIFVSGDFGKVELGDQDSAGDRLMVSGSSANFQFGMYGNYTGSILYNGGYTGGANTAADFSDSSDDTKITYFTPTISGFQAGISFAPDSDTGTTQTGGASTRENHIDGGLKYKDSFNDVAIAVGLVGGTHELSQSGEDDRTYYAVGGGLNVQYAGFVAAVGLMHEDEEDNYEQDTVDFGVGWSSGPWTLSAGAAWSERDFDAAATQKNEYTAYSAGVGYNFAPGLSAWVGGTVGEYENAAEDFDNLQAGVSVSF